METGQVRVQTEARGGNREGMRRRSRGEKEKIKGGELVRRCALARNNRAIARVPRERERKRKIVLLSRIIIYYRNSYVLIKLRLSSIPVRICLHPLLLLTAAFC